MTTNDIFVEHDDGIATVVLNKPDTHNAISLDMYRRIPEIFAELDADAGVKVVVVRGAGTRSFASGADILILPIQDAFGWRDRINQPATVGSDNWTWRMPWPSDRLTTEPQAIEIAKQLQEWSRRHGR